MYGMIHSILDEQARRKLRPVKSLRQKSKKLMLCNKRNGFINELEARNTYAETQST